MLFKKSVHNHKFDYITKLFWVLFQWIVYSIWCPTGPHLSDTHNIPQHITRPTRPLSSNETSTTFFLLQQFSFCNCCSNKGCKLTRVLAMKRVSHTPPPARILRALSMTRKHVCHSCLFHLFLSQYSNELESTRFRCVLTGFGWGCCRPWEAQCENGDFLPEPARLLETQTGHLDGTSAFHSVQVTSVSKRPRASARPYTRGRTKSFGYNYVHLTIRWLLSKINTIK